MGRRALRITVDTNILVRAAVLDDVRQAEPAARLLREADLIAATLPALCEFSRVLRRGYRWSPAEVAGFIRQLLASPAVVVDRPAVEAGLALLDTGGDFADGVIAFEGRRLGAEVFASFDRDAVRLIAAIGGQTHLLANRAG